MFLAHNDPAILTMILNCMLWYGIIIASNGYFLESKLPELIAIAVMVMYVDKPNWVIRHLPCHMLTIVTWDLVHHVVEVVKIVNRKRRMRCTSRTDLVSRILCCRMAYQHEYTLHMFIQIVRKLYDSHREGDS